MDKETFNNKAFGAGMEASCKGKGSYPIVGVDWDNGKISLLINDKYLWVSYLDVEITKE